MSCLPETFNPCQSIKVATKGHEGFFLPQGESLQLERGLNSGVSNATLFYFTGWAEEKPGLLLLPFYSRIVISTASTACKPANLPFQTRKNMWQQIFCWCTFSRSWVEGLYIYIVAIGAGPLSLQSKVLLTVLLAKLMILLRKKSGKYPIISRVLYIPRWLAGFLPSTVVHDDTTTATTATTTTTSSHV